MFKMIYSAMEPSKQQSSKPEDQHNSQNPDNSEINQQPAAFFARTPNPNQVLNQSPINTEGPADKTQPVKMPVKKQPENSQNVISEKSPTINQNNTEPLPTNTNNSNETPKGSTTASQFQPMYGELKTPDYSGHLDKPDISDRIEVKNKSKTNIPLIIGISTMVLIILALATYTAILYTKVKESTDATFFEIVITGIED